jgi:hypothetical protein
MLIHVISRQKVSCGGGVNSEPHPGSYAKTFGLKIMVSISGTVIYIDGEGATILFFYW